MLARLQNFLPQLQAANKQLPAVPERQDAFELEKLDGTEGSVLTQDTASSLTSADIQEASDLLSARAPWSGAALSRSACGVWDARFAVDLTAAALGGSQAATSSEAVCQPEPVNEDDGQEMIHMVCANTCNGLATRPSPMPPTLAAIRACRKLWERIWLSGRVAAWCVWRQELMCGVLEPKQAPPAIASGELLPLAALKQPGGIVELT